MKNTIFWYMVHLSRTNAYLKDKAKLSEKLDNEKWLFSTKLHFAVENILFPNIYAFSYFSFTLKVFYLQRCIIYQKIAFFMAVKQVPLDSQSCIVTEIFNSSVV